MIVQPAHAHAHTSVLPRTASPPLSEHHFALKSTWLPPIARVLAPQAGQDVFQRPRGSTLPSYVSLNTNHSPRLGGESTVFKHSRQRSSTLDAAAKDADTAHSITEGDSPLANDIALPPIRVDNNSPPRSAFNRLPPIKTVLPSPSHMLTLDSRSSASPQTALSAAQLSTSWSSQTQTSASSSDMTGSYHSQSPPFRKYSRPELSHPTPIVHGESNARYPHPREINGALNISPANNIPRTLSESHSHAQPRAASILSLTAPSPRGPSSIAPSSSEREYRTYGRNISPRNRHHTLEESIERSPSSSAHVFPSSSTADSRIPHGASPPGMMYRSGVDVPTSHMHYSTDSHESVHFGTMDVQESDGGRSRHGETAGGKKRRSRATQEQLDILISVYQRTPFPSTVERAELAQKLGMTPRSVQIWFQNRRQGAKNSENRRREQPPLVSINHGSPQMPNLVPLSISSSGISLSQSPPSPGIIDGRSLSYGSESGRDSGEYSENLLGRARRRRMSVNDLLSHDTREELRPAPGSRHASHSGHRSDRRET